MEFIHEVNGCRILLRQCNAFPARRVAVVSHGRFVPLRAVNSGITLEASVPTGLAVNWYVRHGETITNRRVMELFERLHRNESPGTVKDYSTRSTVKNYTLRPEPFLWDVCRPRAGGHCDVILPLDMITTDDILEAFRAGRFLYREVHFLSCRAERLTLSTRF